MNSYLLDLFKMEHLPIKDGEWWDGRPREYSNLKQYKLDFSQKFGGNLEMYKQFKMIGHNGIDIAGLVGTPIVAPCRLWISFIQLDENKGYGNHVYAETESKTINGDTYKLEMVFGHFDTVSTKTAHWVNPGDILGYMGSTGFSTGSHLHLGIRPHKQVNNSTWKIMDYDNGYFGYIDPEPFFPHIVWNLEEILKPEDNIINMLQKFKRDKITGALYFIKKRDDGILYKQKFDALLAPVIGALGDEFGMESWGSDKFLNIPDYKFFG